MAIEMIKTEMAEAGKHMEISAEIIDRKSDSPPFLDLSIKIHFVPGKELRYLPTEVWINILNMVADPNDFCHDCCTSLAFPQFIHEWSILSFSAVIDYRWQIGQLRLVCRAWSLVISPRQSPYVNTMGLSTLPAISAKPSSKSIVTLCIHDCFEAVDPNLQSPAVVDVFRNLNTLIINHIKPYNDRFLHFLPSKAKTLPNLRSFSYVASHDLLPGFWKGLQEAFPNLMALRIRSSGHVNGFITLHNLEILHLITRNPPECRFPKLKHFSSDHSMENHLFNELLSGHGQTLESILLPCYGWDRPTLFRGGFWNVFPKLRLLGTRSFALRELPNPPTGHPFHHLCLSDKFIESGKDTEDGKSITPEWDTKAQYWACLKPLINRLRSLRYISKIASSDVDSFDELMIKDEILRQCGLTRFSLVLYEGELPEGPKRIVDEGAWSSLRVCSSPQAATYVSIWAFRSAMITSAPEDLESLPSTYKV
jgi:hypothetical protein